MPPAGPGAGGSLVTVGGIVLVVAALYFGSEIFIPFALAVLLAFALAPIVDGLRRLRVPKLAAVSLAVACAFVVIGGITYVVGTQLLVLAENLPNYKYNIQQKIRAIQPPDDDRGILPRLSSTLRDLREEFDGADEPETEAPGPTTEEPKPKPVPVTIMPPELRPIEVVATMLGPLLSPLITAGVVIVFIIFVLLERDDLRDRFIRLVGAGDLQRSTEALNEAARRVSRYLLMQLLVNVTYGVPIGIGLYVIGVPNAALWGLLATVLRFIPYLGPFLAALFPVALAFATDSGWSMLIWTVALFVAMEVVSNNLIEPWLYGSSTGLSSLAVIMAAIFWTMLWGPVGLFLSTPLTVCVVVMGRYVPQLNFLGVLLGNDPVLAPEQRFYQRLLSGNVEEAVELAERHVDETSLHAFHNDVALPALRLAENDRQRNTTDVTYRRVVADSAMAVLRETAESVETESEETEPVLCIGGRTELDHAAAEILAQVLAEDDIRARVLPPVSLTRDAIGQLDLAGVEVVCLCYLNPQPQALAKFVSRRLKRQAPRLKIVVCMFNPAPDLAQSPELAQQISADRMALSLDAAVRQVALLIAEDEPGEPVPPPIPENERERLEALCGLGLGTGGNSQLDAFAAKVAAAFDMPIALVSLVDAEHQRWPGAAGLPPDLEASRMAPRSTSICGHVVAGGEPLVIKDVAKDRRFARNPFLLEKGIRFYAGAPLRTSSGFVLGSLCVIDTKPRSFSSKDVKLLQVVAEDLMAQVELQCSRSDDGRSAPQLEPALAGIGDVAPDPA